MTTEDDGGPAFPYTSDGGPWDTGMSLRDYTAIHADLSNTLLDAKSAIQIMGKEPPDDILGMIKFGAELQAKIRYIVADAMLAARKGNAE